MQVSERSETPKLRADEQKRHIRPSLWVSWHIIATRSNEPRSGALGGPGLKPHMNSLPRNPGFRRYGKCRGCGATVHVLIGGDLTDRRPFGVAFPTVMPEMTGQESAEAIVPALTQGRAELRKGLVSLQARGMR